MRRIRGYLFERIVDAELVCPVGVFQNSQVVLALFVALTCLIDRERKKEERKTVREKVSKRERERRGEKEGEIEGESVGEWVSERARAREEER